TSSPTLPNVGPQNRSGSVGLGPGGGGTAVTKDKDVKDVVRARAAKTGESSAATRRQLERKPRSTVWQKSLLTQYRRVLSAFEDTLKRCPDDRWSKSLWVVKQDDPGAWPESGLGADLPDDERLQLQSA